MSPRTDPPNKLEATSPIEGLVQEFLSDNLAVFTWTPTDMPGIDPDIICHKLSIKADTKLGKQKPRRMNKE